MHLTRLRENSRLLCSDLHQLIIDWLRVGVAARRGLNTIPPIFLGQIELRVCLLDQLVFVLQVRRPGCHPDADSRFLCRLIGKINLLLCHSPA